MTESKPSKSELKLRQLELQRLGESLIGLDADALASLPLYERLRDAVLHAGKIRSRGALRRQKQLIGKLMRDVDAEPIRAALVRLGADDAATRRLFAEAERWRDRIVAEGPEALSDFVTTTGVSDTELGKWLAELAVCGNERVEKTLRRKIFRRVHQILVKISS